MIISHGYGHEGWACSFEHQLQGVLVHSHLVPKSPLATSAIHHWHGIRRRAIHPVHWPIIAQKGYPRIDREGNTPNCGLVVVSSTGAAMFCCSQAMPKSMARV
jgi:hypothetical protein